MTPAPTPPDALADDALSTWATACIVATMGEQGIAPRQQATWLARVCGISVSQARRKLKGASWLFSEVLMVCRHVGLSLDAVFTASVLQNAGGSALGTGPSRAHHPALLLLDGQQLPCEVQLGPLCAGGTEPGLLAALVGDLWQVGTAQALERSLPAGRRYRIEHLQWTPPAEAPRPRIAVVDDDASSAQALSDWFNEVGYKAEAYTAAEPLLHAPPGQHDAYVIDLILAGGQTSQALVEFLRQQQPHAPIVLLTGQLRDGTASEATLATILRTQGVTFFEKPVRPAVLTAAIQSSLDRAQMRHG